MKPWLVLLVLLLLLSVCVAAAAPAGYSDPVALSVSDDLVVSVSDDVVFRTAYFSVGGGAWQPLALDGRSFVDGWLRNAGSAQLDASLFSGVPESYVAVFSCSRSFSGGQPWSCHDGRWQLYSFIPLAVGNVSVVAVSSSFSEPGHEPFLVLDGVELDLELFVLAFCLAYLGFTRVGFLLRLHLVMLEILEFLF